MTAIEREIQLEEEIRQLVEKYKTIKLDDLYGLLQHITNKTAVDFAIIQCKELYDYYIYDDKFITTKIYYNKKIKHRLEKRAKIKKALEEEAAKKRALEEAEAAKEAEKRAQEEAELAEKRADEEYKRAKGCIIIVWVVVFLAVLLGMWLNWKIINY